MEDLLTKEDVATDKDGAISKFKQWFDEQVWTKQFRKAYGLKITPSKRTSKKQRRNALCECNSGLKHKKCCYGKDV